MPDVDALITSTLEALGVPVARLLYTGKADTFLTFQLVVGQDTAFSDDDSEAEDFLYRVDVYSRVDYIALLRRTKKALKEAGFYGITINPEVYEPDTGYFHVPIEVKYMVEV